MSPKELRAFRERLGLSRRDFAPKLFISEPTLERWERGQGGPREVHLQVLRRMREHLGAGYSLSYFHYDAGAEPLATELQNENKEMIAETLRGLGALALHEEVSDDGNEWLISFGLGWAVGEKIELSLHCEGSERPDRPAIDFTLEIIAPCRDTKMLSAHLQRVCRNHSVFGSLSGRSDARCVVTLRNRLFNTGCNPETIRHILGSFGSCYQRLRSALAPDSPRGETAQSASERLENTSAAVALGRERS